MPSGRRPKLTPETKEIILGGIRAGMSYKSACELARIVPATFYRWQELGEAEQSGIYFEFLNDVKNVQSEVNQRMLQVVQDAAEKGTQEVVIVTKRDGEGNIIEQTQTQKSSPGDWRAAMTFLERRNPEEFSRRFIHHDGKIDNPSAALAQPPVVNLIFDDGEGDPKRVTGGILFPANANGNGIHEDDE